MNNRIEIKDFEFTLANEHPRLVRLCAWFIHDNETAQDLAQETLMIAWKNREQLLALEKMKPWTSAIARNVCLDWSRRHSRERARVLLSVDEPGQAFDEEFSDGSDLELELDRHELAILLDQAFAMLPPETGRMLIEHYIDELPQAEIAAKRKLKTGAVAVRLQRGKLTLRKLLRSKLQGQDSADGRISDNAQNWEQTNIWCPSCGNIRLLGRYKKDTIFALRCPTCDPDPGMLVVGLDLTQPSHARLLGNVRMYKPAYSRLLAAFAPLYQQALHKNRAPCLACGHDVHVSISEIATKTHEGRTKKITLWCPACEWTSNKSLSGLVFSIPEVQQFWKEHPRLRVLPMQEVDVDGTKSFVGRLQSVQDNAELTVITRGDTLLPTSIHSNVVS